MFKRMHFWQLQKGAFLLLMLFFGVFPKDAFADESEGFSVTPFYSSVTLDSKDAQEGIDLQFSNRTSYDAVFKLSVADFGALDETGGVAFVGSEDIFSKKYGLASWVFLEKDAVVLGKGGTQTVHITIQNKDSLSPGGHYAAIVAKLDEKSFSDLQKNSSDVTFNPSFTSLIFAKKIGGERYDLDLKEFFLARSLLSLPTSVRLRFQNRGNVHVVPRGTVEVSDPFGKEIQKGVINVDSSIVLPETFRMITASLLPIQRAIIPGTYTIFIRYRFDGSDDFFVQQKTFFCVPPLFFETMLLVSLLGSIFVWWKKKLDKKNESHGTRTGKKK